MKIAAFIPVKRLSQNGLTTYEYEWHEVEVLRVIRYPATRYHDLNRWHYCADISDHPAMCHEAIRIGLEGAYRTNIVRPKNTTWKPPVFSDGSNVFYVKEARQ